MTEREKFERLVFQAVINYPSYDTRERTIGDAQVTLHKVGHNATHNFWLGLTQDNQLVYMSVGESYESGMIEEHVRIYPHGEYPSYIGHW